MKDLKKTLGVIILFIILFHSCKKDKDPQISTSTVSDITATNATTGGNITDAGSSNIISRGVCWSTGTLPTIIDSKTTDGTGMGSFSSTITGLNAVTIYYVRAYATNSSGTGYGTSISFTTQGQTPSPTVAAASNLTDSKAKLNGSVNANYLSTVVTFEYGTTVNYGSTATALQSPVSGNSITTVSADISGLSPGIVYHYRIKAGNSLGTNFSSDIQFSTLGMAPTAYTLSSSDIMSTSAKLNGTVNAHYVSTDVIFEYGTTSNYGSSITALQNPVTGNESTEVNSRISGLTVGTIYHYRVKAINQLGTSYGSDMTFTTAYSIGENANGGLVFYIDNSGKHGLVCAPTEQGTAVEWGCWGTEITGADGTVVGTGNQNTIDIINGCTSEEIAAKICYDLNLNGYSDWFLPSKDELGLMYTNLKVNGFGDFTGQFYWSSTEAPYNDAWAQIFNSGVQARLGKNSLDHHVRAVRIF